MLPLSGVQPDIGIVPDPALMSPAEFGWDADIENKTLLARSLPDATGLAPDYILRPIRCSCHSGVPCKAGNCSCLRNQLICTVFCACEGNRLCCNPYTEHKDDGDDYLYMFDDAGADCTVNWSLWRTSSLIWHHIKLHDTMKGPEISEKQCIMRLFLWKFSALGAFCHVALKVTWQNVPTALDIK